jgi:hypothetical protein
MFCCFSYNSKSDTTVDDNYNSLHNDNSVRVNDEKIRGPSADSYSLSDEAIVSYDQIYHTYYR